MESIDSAAFRQALETAIGAEDASKAIAAMHSEPSISVRLNPSKPASSPLPILDGATQVPWSSYGYLLQERPVFTLHPLFHAGAYYVQDSSAMFVGWLFRSILDRYPQRPLKVLDLCAAPGGKTTDLAASLREACGDAFLLVANEVMRQRASVLSDNVAVWGDPNVVVTSVDPKAFAQYEGFFDIIVTDVPCSGEGMFRKDTKAVEDWSPETVALCAARQKRILADVWPSLKAGGALVYSTCTFEPAENDMNLQWAASELGGEVIEPQNPFGIRTTSCGHLLIPGEVPGEGQWAGALIKSGNPAGGQVLSVVSSMEQLKRLHPLRMGVNKGETKGKDFVPSADWALSIAFDRNAYPAVEVDKKTALKFLHKDTIALPDAPLGYNVLTYRGLPVGFVKNLGSRCNNLHPQSRRIRMDI
ncbi:MAG: rRNA cytosine-C5-methyltransferase [Bacteroidia bacterium]|nr:rRNA cytosine-C5-methyltransferase [Bacteroidia bacterium]